MTKYYIQFHQNGEPGIECLEAESAKEAISQFRFLHHSDNRVFEQILVPGEELSKNVSELLPVKFEGAFGSDTGQPDFERPNVTKDGRPGKPRKKPIPPTPKALLGYYRTKARKRKP